MEIFHSLNSWRGFRKTAQFRNKTIGFVPTMGNLHCGHLSLVNRSTKENDITVLSLFVNPTQFDNEEDYLLYPKTLTTDLRKAEEENVDYVLAPNYKAIYPDNFRFKVHEDGFSQIMEGKFRPGHFDGVLTVILKYLMLVRPTKAYFGEKDYQQYRLIKDMAKSFFLDTKILRCRTVREKDGLAHSSRNFRLTPEERALAPQFPALLKHDIPINELKEYLRKAGFKVDYVEENGDRRFAAVQLGNIRLLDNMKIKSLKNEVKALC